MGKEYEIAPPTGTCCRCRRELTGGEEFTAMLFEADGTFRRDDLCLVCWQAGGQQAPGAFSVWRGRVSLPQQPQHRYVGDEVLLDFFERLVGQSTPAQVNFRFVLALLLMRKKLLVYDGASRDEAGDEVWTMHLRNDPSPVMVVHPEMDEQQIAEVTAQLGAIFQTDV